MDMAQTLAWIEANKGVKDAWLKQKPEPVSEWLIQIISDSLKASGKGIAYNADIVKLACELGGLPYDKSDYQSGGVPNLSGLVYNAQTERHKREHKAAGWFFPSVEWLKEHEGQTVEKFGESIFGQSARPIKIRFIGGEYWLMKKGARNRGWKATQSEIREIKAENPKPIQYIAVTVGA